MIYNSTKNLLAFHYSNAVWLRFFFANNLYSIMHALAHSLSHLAIGIRLNRKLSCLISIVFLASILAAIDFHRACIFAATTQHKMRDRSDCHSSSNEFSNRHRTNCKMRAASETQLSVANINNGTRNVIFIFNYIYCEAAFLYPIRMYVYHFYWEFCISLAFNSNRFAFIANCWALACSSIVKLKWKWNEMKNKQTDRLKTMKAHLLVWCNSIIDNLFSKSMRLKVNSNEKSMDCIYVCSMGSSAFHYTLINGYQLLFFHFWIECQNWF